MVRKNGKKPVISAWIFCEGEKTEFYYFSKLKAEQRLGRLRLKIAPSENRDPVGLVNYAAEFKKHRRDYISGDLIFCVFDRDDNSNQALEKAKKLAKDSGMGLVFSNPCFEYWLLSHFEYYPQAIESDLIFRKLNKSLGKYRKKDPEIYMKTKDNIENAISNSRKVLEKHNKNYVDVLSRESNPSTLVFELIEKLNEFQ